MFNELDACFSIDQILEIVRKIIGVFGRPEIYESFGVFKVGDKSYLFINHPNKTLILFAN